MEYLPGVPENTMYMIWKQREVGQHLWVPAYQENTIYSQSNAASHSRDT
jgi:hypothetical protein